MKLEMKLERPLHRLLAAVCCALILTAAVPVRGQTPDTPASALDRELVVRFTRAYGMAKEAFSEHVRSDPPREKRDAMLRQPDELDHDLRQEVERILDLNGLQRDEWRQMFARMETDRELRERVESLSTPFDTE